MHLAKENALPGQCRECVNLENVEIQQRGRTRAACPSGLGPPWRSFSAAYNVPRYITWDNLRTAYIDILLQKSIKYVEHVLMWMFLFLAIVGCGV